MNCVCDINRISEASNHVRKIFYHRLRLDVSLESGAFCLIWHHNSIAPSTYIIISIQFSFFKAVFWHFKHCNFRSLCKVGSPCMLQCLCNHMTQPRDAIIKHVLIKPTEKRPTNLDTNTDRKSRDRQSVTPSTETSFTRPVR